MISFFIHHICHRCCCHQRLIQPFPPIKYSPPPLPLLPLITLPLLLLLLLDLQIIGATPWRKAMLCFIISSDKSGFPWWYGHVFFCLSVRYQQTKFIDVELEVSVLHLTFNHLYTWIDSNNFVFLASFLQITSSQTLVPRQPLPFAKTCPAIK